MNTPDPWRRLVAAARSAPDDRDESAPFGFSARVAHLAMTRKTSAFALFERFSLRALVCACLLALCAAGASYRSLVGLMADNRAPVAAAVSPAPEVTPSDDPVGDLVAVVS